MIIELLEISYSIQMPRPPNYIIKFINDKGFHACYLVEEFTNVLDAMLKIHEIAAFKYSGWAIPHQLPTKEYFDSRPGVIRQRLVSKFKIEDSQVITLYTMNPEDKF